MRDAHIRGITRPHRDGGPIRRLYATGETAPALGLRAQQLADQGHHAEADALDDVIAYVAEAGTRPPVRRWITSH